jgi:hypothetical protein
MWIHDAGKKKKADVKVVETVKSITDDEIRMIIADKIAAKESMLNIRIFLAEENFIEEERINGLLIEFVKVDHFNSAKTIKACRGT